MPGYTQKRGPAQVDGTAHLLDRCSAALVSGLGHDESTAKEIAAGKAEELLALHRHVR